MKRTFKYALTAVLAAAIAVPAMAQDNFPDVPDNHWAYEALARMKKEGLLVGYPDGLYRGGRPASRYEMAVALHALFLRIKDIEASLTNQINELNTKISGMGQGGGASQADLDNLRSALAALQSDVNGMKAWGDDIAALKRAADTFQKELSSMGVDVEAMKKDLADINARLKKLEGQKAKVDISGDVNIIALGGNGEDGFAGMDKDGRTYGWLPGPTRDGDLINPGITRDMTIFHEAAITLKSTNDEGPKWWGTLVFGNLLDGPDGPAFGNQSELFPGFRYHAGEADTYIQNLGVNFNAGFANVTLGRVGYKVSPMIYQRTNNTSYFSNSRWDNGEWLMDGGILNFKLGMAKLDVFAGNTGSVFSNWETKLQPMAVGPIDIDQVLGFNLNLPIGDRGNIDLAYLYLDTLNPVDIGGGGEAVDQVNRANVYGGSATYNLGKIGLSGGYSVNTWGYNTDTKIDKDNTAWYAGATFAIGPVDVSANYREVEANYMAPGDWGRVGIERNPNNIKGFDGMASVKLGSNLTLGGGAKIYEAKDKDLVGTLSGFSDKLDMYYVHLKYAFSSDFYASLGYESTKFNNVFISDATAEDSEYKWTTIGLGYKMNDAAMLKVWYEISDIKNERNGLLGSGGRGKGGMLGAQLGIKF